MNIALYAGIIGGVVAAIVVIGIISYCCCCRDSKDTDYEMTWVPLPTGVSRTDEGFSFSLQHQQMEWKAGEKTEIWESVHCFLLSVPTPVAPISPHGTCPGAPDTFVSLGRTKLFKPWIWISTHAMKKTKQLIHVLHYQQDWICGLQISLEQCKTILTQNLFSEVSGWFWLTSPLLNNVLGCKKTTMNPPGRCRQGMRCMRAQRRMWRMHEWRSHCHLQDLLKHRQHCRKEINPSFLLQEVEL